MLVKDMTHQECMTLIGARRLGRLACCRHNQPYIIPVHYALGGSCLYSFSMPGQKIDWMRENPRVCIEIDEISSGGDWRSVVVQGKYLEFPDTEQWHRERVHAWSMLQKYGNWWEPGALKPDPQAITGASPHLFYGIDIAEVTGRKGIAGDA